jgi:hypothetical protein
MSLGVYKINYDIIIEDTNTPIAIRLLAAKLKINPMMMVGKFFANLSDTELYSLRDLTFDTEASAPELLLLTMMLSAAEGTSALDDDELISHVNATNFFIATSVLHDQGFCKAHFDKFSYGDDMSHHVLAEPTELGLKYAEQLKKDNNNE